MASNSSDTDLPKALIKRIVKGKLAQAAGDDSKDYQLNKDALLAFSEAAKVFISYISSTANEVCREGKRHTISAEDVFTALNDVELVELIQPLREHLDAFRRAAKEKTKRKSDATKKRKQAAASDDTNAEDAEAPAENNKNGPSSGLSRQPSAQQQQPNSTPSPAPAPTPATFLAPRQQQNPLLSSLPPSLQAASFAQQLQHLTSNTNATMGGLTFPSQAPLSLLHLSPTLLNNSSNPSLAHRTLPASLGVIPGMHNLSPGAMHQTMLSAMPGIHQTSPLPSFQGAGAGLQIPALMAQLQSPNLWSQLPAGLMASLTPGLLGQMPAATPQQMLLQQMQQQQLQQQQQFSMQPQQQLPVVAGLRTGISQNGGMTSQQPLLQQQQQHPVTVVAPLSQPGLQVPQLDLSTPVIQVHSLPVSSLLQPADVTPILQPPQQQQEQAQP